MEELIFDYENNLLTIKELSNKYHIGQKRVKEILIKNNKKIRTNSETYILKKNKGFSLEEIENKVINNYVQKGWGQIKSGKEFGLSAAKVKKILSKNGIEIRDFSQAANLSNRNRDCMIYKKDINFFKTENSNMAWLLGFLASDGNISKNGNRIRIELSIVDKEILEKIKEIVSIENPIYEREDKRGFKFVSLEWSCKEHKKDLAKYSIVPKKTYTLLPPAALNSKYYIDYIRGYFDGDGTININHCQNGNSLRWGICGASKTVLQWIIKVLNEQYNIPSVNLHKDRSKDNDFWSFTYSTNSVKKIYKILYTPDSIYLKRKKDKFEKLLKEYSIKE